MHIRLRHLSPERLTIGHAPWGWALGLGGACVLFTAAAAVLLRAGVAQGAMLVLPVLVAGGLFAVLVRPVRVEFEAPAALARINARSLFGASRLAIALTPQTRVALRDVPGRGGARVLQLVQPDGESSGAYVLGDPSRRRGLEELAGTINHWLKEAF